MKLVLGLLVALSGKFDAVLVFGFCWLIGLVGIEFVLGFYESVRWPESFDNRYLLESTSKENARSRSRISFFAGLAFACWSQMCRNST